MTDFVQIAIAADSLPAFPFVRDRTVFRTDLIQLQNRFANDLRRPPFILLLVTDCSRV